MGYSFEEHLAKETRFADQIGLVYPYLAGEKDLEELRSEDEELYLKLRDNPERIRLITNLPRGGSCLDVGCSDGVITLELARSGVQKILGIDIRRDAVKNANNFLANLLTETRKAVSFRVAVPEELTAAGLKFDTIYFTEVLEHIEPVEHNKVLAILKMLMRAGSNLIISVPNRHPARHYESERRQRWDAPGHCAYFSRDSLALFLDRHFAQVDFYTLQEDRSPEEGIWLVCNCQLPRI